MQRELRKYIKQGGSNMNIEEYRKKYKIDNNKKCLLSSDTYGAWHKKYSGCHWCGIYEKCKKENPIIKKRQKIIL